MNKFLTIFTGMFYANLLALAALVYLVFRKVADLPNAEGG